MRYLILLVFLTVSLVAQAAERSIKTEDASALARRMAAEIVELAAQDNKTYREVLLDVGTALRNKQMTVAEAKDLLTLAAACRELGASRRQTEAASQQFDQVLSGNTEKAPEMLDIDKLLDEEMVASAAKEDPIFGNAKADASSNKTSTRGTGNYLGGTAGRKLPWDSDSELRRSHKASNTAQERSDLAAASANAVTDDMLAQASDSKTGTVGMIKPGSDGTPSVVLVNIPVKKSLKVKDSVIISRKGQALVKAEVHRCDDFEAFVIIKTDTWASGIDKKLVIGDKVQVLK